MKESLIALTKTDRASPVSKAFSFNLQQLLSKKYSCAEYTLTYISTQNLVFNEKCSIVSRFKDFLIYDDSTDFLRRFYTKEESDPRLSRILSFYETYSKIFPNYMTLPESEHLYKNIRKKQKMIDAMNAIKQEEEENRKKIAKTYKSSIETYQSNCNTVFTPKIHKSILKYQPSAINDQTFSEASVSISIMFKKFVPNFNGSFAMSDFIEDNQPANANSITEIISVMNGRINPHAINVQQKRLNENLSTQQTPKREKKTISSVFQSESLYTKNTMTTSYGNRTSKNANGKVMRKMPVSPSAKNATPKSIVGHNINNVPQAQGQAQAQAQPVNNLKIITNNFQNIILPLTQVDGVSQGGNTVININNNFYTCTDAPKEQKDSKRMQSLSPKQVHKAAKTGKPMINPNLFSPKATSLKASRSIKREPSSPLKSFSGVEKRLKNNDSERIKTISNNINNVRTSTNSANLHKSRGKSLKPASQSSRRTKEKKPNTNLNQFNKVNTDYYLSQMTSPKREREISKERELTNKIRHKFKLFIEKSKLNSLSNRGLSDSFSPKKSGVNKLSSAVTTNNNSMHRNQTNTHSQQKISINPDSQIKVLSTVSQRLQSPVAAVEAQENVVPKIKVNTRPFMERTMSNGFMIMSHMQRNLNLETS